MRRSQAGDRMQAAYRYAKGRRQQRIMDALTAMRSMRLNELVEALGVSSETIRRDLRELDERGLISRTYGGAVRLFDTEPALSERMRMMTDEREAIAAAVSASVQPNQVLLVGGGATTLHVARRLAHDHHALTVVTHALDIVGVLGSKPGITVICAPGQYDAREALLVGHETVAFLRSFAAHRAILGATGIADHGKFGTRALKLYGTWGEAVELVCDRAPPEAIAAGIARAGGRIVVADAAEPAGAR